MVVIGVEKVEMVESIELVEMVVEVLTTVIAPDKETPSSVVV